MATNFYKQGTSYFTQDGTKIADPTALQALAKAGGKEIAAPASANTKATLVSPTGQRTEATIGTQTQDLFKQGYQLEQKIPTPAAVPDFTVTNKTSNALYGVKEPIVPERTGNLDVNKGADTTITGGGSGFDINTYMAGADAYQRAMAAQLQQQQEQLDKQQEGYNKIQADAQKGLTDLGGFDGQKLYDEFSKTRGLQDKQNQLTEINMNLASTNAQLQQEMQVIDQKPVLGAIIQGQKLFKMQEYLPKTTMLQAQAEILKGDIDSANKFFQNYYTWSKDAHDEQKSNYERLFDLADRRLIALDSTERAIINDKMALLEKQSQKEQDNKDKLSGLMLQYPEVFAKSRVLPTDDYQTAIKKMVPNMNMMDEKQVTLGMIAKYPDAGILPSDSIATATKKMQNSKSYKLSTTVSSGGGGGSSSSTKQSSADQKRFDDSLQKAIETVTSDKNKWGQEWNYMYTMFGPQLEAAGKQYGMSAAQVLDQLMNKNMNFPGTAETQNGSGGGIGDTLAGWAKWIGTNSSNESSTPAIIK